MEPLVENQQLMVPLDQFRINCGTLEAWCISLYEFSTLNLNKTRQNNWGMPAKTCYRWHSNDQKLLRIVNYNLKALSGGGVTRRGNAPH